MHYKSANILAFNEISGVAVTYQVEVEENYVLPLPDELCRELGINVGDFLSCKLVSSSSEIEMTKYIDQTLSDDEVVAVGNLSRVISLMQDENFEMNTEPS